MSGEVLRDVPSQRDLTRRASWGLALVATFTMAVSYVDRQTLAALAPTVTADLGIDDASYGLLQSAFSIAYLVGAPLAGRWIDRVGARSGLLGAVLVWSLVAALHAVAPGFGALFALRIALGLAEAPSFPGAAQTVQRVLPPAERSLGFGVLFTGSSIGAAVAPLLAVGLHARFGWRAAFVGTALLGLSWVPLWLFATRSREAKRALAPSARRERADEPAAPSLVLHPAVLRAVLVVVASAPIIAFFLLWSSKFLVTTFGLHQGDVGRYLWFTPLFFDLGSVGFGAAASRLGRRSGPHDAPRGLLAFAMLLSASAIFVPLAVDPWSAIVLGGVAMAGGGGLFALVTADMLARVPRNRISTAGGLTAAAQSLAYIVANPIIGQVVQRTHRYDAVIVGLACWVLPGCLAWIAWRPPPRVAHEPGEIAAT